MSTNNSQTFYPWLTRFITDANFKERILIKFTKQFKFCSTYICAYISLSALHLHTTLDFYSNLNMFLKYFPMHIHICTF